MTNYEYPKHYIGKEVTHTNDHGTFTGKIQRRTYGGDCFQCYDQKQDITFLISTESVYRQIGKVIYKNNRPVLIPPTME